MLLLIRPADYINFYTNPNLQSILLKENYGTPVAKLPLLCDILSTIPSASLRRLSIELDFTERDPKNTNVDVNAPAVDKSDTFTVLDKLLQTQKFLSLELVSVRVKAADPLPPEGNVLFPKTHARRILQWKYWQVPRLDW